MLLIFSFSWIGQAGHDQRQMLLHHRHLACVQSPSPKIAGKKDTFWVVVYCGITNHFHGPKDCGMQGTLVLSSSLLVSVCLMGRLL